MTKPKILIVEDETLVARDIAQQLLDLGYDPVAEVRKAEEAILRCEQLQPDLVLMDIQLAGEMDGIAAAQIIRGRFALPVVFLTALAGDSIIHQAKVTEPFGYIIKPFDERELRMVIEMALSKHRAERNLQVSEERHRTIVEHSGEGIGFVNADEQFEFANRAAEKIFGVDPGGLVGRSLAQFVSADQYQMIRQETALRAHGRQSVYELKITQPSGGERSIIVTAVPQYDQARVFVGTHGIFRDITEQEQTAELLRDADWKFRALFENGPIGVAYHRMIYDAAGRPIDYYFIDANDKYIALTGVDPKGKTVTQAFPGIERDPFDWIGTFGRVARTGETIRFQQYLQTNHRWYDCVGYQYKPDHFVAAFLEITESKRAEEALRRNEARQSAMVANIGDVIAIIDSAGINRYKSPNIEKWFGWRPEEVVGVSALANVHPEDQAHAGQFIGDLLGKPHATGTTECRYRCKDGAYKWISFTGINLLHDPNIQGLLGNYHDITRRKEAELERVKLETQFQQAQKMEAVGRLAGGVAHDFNNMLQAIMGNVDLAMEGVTPGSPTDEGLREIRKCAERSADLTRQLLAFARRQTIAPEVLNLNTTVESLLKILRRLIGEDIDLAWLPAGKLGLVKMDPTQIDQILANLCVNARDAIGGVGKVTIETANAAFDEAYCSDHPGYLVGEYVRLTVSDNGIGMDKATQAQIFEPFFTTKGKGAGTGLGLATVYGVVKQNGGFINVYSEPGCGTTFTLYLPRHAGEAAATGTASEPEIALSAGETVLLVEDEPAVREIARMTLERLGYVVRSASTPGAAIRLAETHVGEIHLLLTDVIMPGMNGRELNLRLLALRPKLKCLFMSGYTADVIGHHGVLETGVNFIQKPFSMADLAAKVRMTLSDSAPPPRPQADPA